MNIKIDNYHLIKEKLKIINEIKKGDKLGINEDEYYIDTNYIGISLNRFWNNQSRYNISKKLCIDIDLLIKNIDNLISDIGISDVFIDSISFFINNLKNGLNNLKITYENCFSFKSNKNILHILKIINSKLGLVSLKLLNKKNKSIKNINTVNYYDDNKLDTITI